MLDRDQAALQLLNTLCGSVNEYPEHSSPQEMSRLAVAYADALIAELASSSTAPRGCAMAGTRPGGQDCRAAGILPKNRCAPCRERYLTGAAFSA